MKTITVEGQKEMSDFKVFKKLLTRNDIEADG